MKSIIVVFLAVLTCCVLYALPAGNTGGVMVSWLPAYSSDYPNASYFKGFNVYYGSTTNLVSDLVIQVSQTTTNLPIQGLVRGTTYWFTVTQVPTNNVESDPGNFVSYTVPSKPPKPGTVTTN